MVFITQRDRTRMVTLNGRELIQRDCILLLGVFQKLALKIMKKSYLVD
jgi:hypothetical protein